MTAALVWPMEFNPVVCCECGQLVTLGASEPVVVTEPRRRGPTEVTRFRCAAHGVGNTNVS